MAIELGDMVKINSGGPLMTVTGFYEHKGEKVVRTCHHGHEEGVSTMVGFREKCLVTRGFPEDALTVVIKRSLAGDSEAVDTGSAEKGTPAD